MHNINLFVEDFGHEALLLLSEIQVESLCLME